MWNWTKDTIINGAKIAEVAPDLASDVNVVYDTAVKRFVVKRGGEYFAENVANCEVFFQEGNEGVKSQAQIKVGTAPEVGTILHVSLDMRMDNRYYAEFARVNWMPFGRPIMFDIEVKEASASAIAKAMEEAFNEVIPYDNRFMSAKADGAVVVFTCADEYARILAVSVTAFNDKEYCEDCGVNKYGPIEGFECKVVKDGKEPFATAEWLQENLRFPSYPNLRYAGQYEDERPVKGTVYDMFAFQYTVPVRGHGGMGFAGQEITSTTTHIFYVNHDSAADFKTMLGEIGLTVNEHGANPVAKDEHAEKHGKKSKDSVADSVDQNGSAGIIGA